jgi:hypothetical protein
LLVSTSERWNFLVLRIYGFFFALPLQEDIKLYVR